MDEVFGVTIEILDVVKPYSPEFQTKAEFDKGWQSALKKAYQNAVVRCQCKGKGERRLAIKHSSASGRFSLAKFCLTGHNHAHDCRFHAANPAMSGTAGYVSGVIDPLDDGRIAIKLGIGLKLAEPKALETPSLPPVRNGRPAGQAAMRLLGLLHLLWEESGLNTWRPGFKGKRSKEGAQKWIRAAASNIFANRVELQDVLILPAEVENGVGHKLNEANVKAAIAHGRRLVVIAVLAKFQPAQQEATRLRISGFHGVPYIFVTPTLWARVSRRFPIAYYGAWRQGHQTIAILQVEMRTTKTGSQADAVDMALMAVNKNWIPFESSYEMKIADMLCAADRAFTKPLRYDAAADAVFPDFILTDTTRDLPMEVFGRTNEAYAIRQDQKVAYYSKNFGTGNWWCWNAATDLTGAAIPPFPAKSSA